MCTTSPTQLKRSSAFRLSSLLAFLFRLIAVTPLPTLAGVFGIALIILCSEAKTASISKILNPAATEINNISSEENFLYSSKTVLRILGLTANIMTSLSLKTNSLSFEVLTLNLFDKRSK